jgi:hypothetical protein
MMGALLPMVEMAACRAGQVSAPNSRMARVKY